MPITPTTFRNHKALGSLTQLSPSVAPYRAYADVIIINPANGLHSSVLQCLVDTGSDYTILPIAFATAVGLTIPPNSTATFRTAGGTSYSLPLHPAVDLQVEGYAITVRVAFSSASAFTMILGRLELVQAFDVGFDITNWYWD